jgi:peptide/nickel transport system ATP-binding protein
MTEPERLLTIKELSVVRPAEPRTLVDRVSFGVDVRDTLVLLGESGCGNAVLLRALAKTLDSSETLTGELRVFGPADRGHFAAPTLRMTYLPGPAARPLSPHASVVSQLSRVIARKLRAPVSTGRVEFAQMLERVKGSPPLAAFERRAAELKPEILAWGLLAAALAQTPDLLLIDHLFEGLPPQPQRQLEAAVLEAKAQLKFTLLCATMSTATALRLGGRLIVMRHGRIVEEGPLERLATAQAHAYTQMLFHDPVARPRSGQRGQPVVQAFGIGFESAAPRETFSFELRRGASLALIGETGSGRHTLARMLLGMARAPSGRIVFDAVDIGILSGEMMSRLRRRVAVISGADDVLDPRMTLWETVAEPLRAHLRLPGDLVTNYGDAALRRVGLASLPGETGTAALSTFDRRRLQVARAIVTAPVLAIVDEPLRGLDAFAQSVMRDLLQSFRADEGPAFLVITSDIAVARALAEEAIVLQDRRIVERGALEEILRAPRSAYTKALVAASAPRALSPVAAAR